MSERGMQYMPRHVLRDAETARRAVPLFERLLGAVAPGIAARRLDARMRLERETTRYRSFDAADRGRRAGKWRAAGSSADAEAWGSLGLLRARARDLDRNNSWTNRAVRAISTRTVGVGIVPRLAEGATKKAWQEWAETPLCDHIGRADVYQIQQQAMRSVVLSGEILLRRYLVPGDGVPLRLQMLEPDFLVEWKDGPTPDGGRIVQGVEFDAEGRRVAYHLYRQHPGDRWYLGAALLADRIPADEILHVFRPERPHQSRGLPWGHSCFMRLRDWDQFVDATLMRMKNAAAFVGFVRDIQVEPIQVPNDPTSPDSVVEFEPGTWETLPNGKSIEFSNPPGADGSAEFTAAVLREIASAYGVTYEVLTSDYSQVNFTSGRAGFLEFDAEVKQWQEQIVVGQLMRGIWGWFSKFGTLAGVFDRKEEYPAFPEWIAPHREMLDPNREVLARVAKVRAGFTTLSAEILAEGREPQEVFDQRQKDDASLDDRELVVDSDPRLVAASEVANPAAVPAPGEPGKEGAAKNGAVEKVPRKGSRLSL